MIDSEQPRHRYRITHVWGGMEGQLEVGAIIVDYEGVRREGRIWSIVNLDTHEETGGFGGVYLGEREDSHD